MEAFIFQCSICGDTSTKLCVYCTKDACNNHLCDRCHRCSDCCLCDLPANAPEISPQLGKHHDEPVPGFEAQSDNLEASGGSTAESIFSH
jgi:hypothetical protein